MGRLRVGLKNNIEVVIIGAAIVDLPLRPIPEDILHKVSYPVDEIKMTVGGDAINEATILTRLGHCVRLVSGVGDDPAGNFVWHHCTKNHIVTDYIAVKEDMNTSINVGLVGRDGERTFITNRNGSLWKLALCDINLEALDEGTILSFASIFNNPLLDNDAMVQIFRRAKTRSMTICADIVKCRLGENLDDIREALSFVDYFFPNFEEAQELTGKENVSDIADVFLACGVRNVIIKTGKTGAFIKNSHASFQVGAYPYVNCIDTTGAGDNFAAAFICGLLEEKTLQECGEFANAIASISVEAIGATEGVQSREQADARYKDYLKWRVNRENN
ncbi:MAG TPA: sugar kinase [Negativicutes bacterium]|nr:sugar kinase [Negativicutes bacterium]